MRKILIFNLFVFKYEHGKIDRKEKHIVNNYLNEFLMVCQDIYIMITAFSEADKKLIKEYIDSQPIKAVIKLDIDKETIQYHDDIKQYRKISTLKDEELTRSILITKLANEFKYPLNSIEIEHEYTAGRPHTNTSRIDVIVRDEDGEAFLFIEVKKPEEYAFRDKDTIIEEQLFKVAGMERTEGHSVKYLILYTVDIDSLKISNNCMIIDNEKYFTFKDWENIRDFFTEIPESYGAAKKEPYIKGGPKELERNFTGIFLDYLQNDLHNVLWGGGGTDDNDIFSSLTNLILSKIQDEYEKTIGDAYDFQTFSFESPEELYERINKLYRRALKEKLNIIDEKQLEKSQVVDTNKFSILKLKYTVQSLERYSFVDGKNSFSGKDILGDFFESIIRTGFKQSKGQFFTHINIVRFMLWAIQADKLAIQRINRDKEIPYMIDPSAGSGTFLIEYMKFITENIKYRFRNKLDTNRAVKDKVESDWFYPDNRENKWAREYIYGSELNFNLGTATKVNMILHGDGSSNIFVGAQKGDGLLPFSEYIKTTAPNALNKESEDQNYSKKINGQFDLILTNPPFSVNLDNTTKKKLIKSFVFSEKKNSENLFLERYYQLLKENGRLAVVLPESVFDTTENKYIRLFLYKYFKIKAVISLPQSTFAPFTNTKTSILFAQKKTVEEIKTYNNIWDTYSEEYNSLKSIVENLMDVYTGKKKKNKLPIIKNLLENEEREILNRFLKEYVEENDFELSNDNLVTKYKEEILDLFKCDKDTKAEFGNVNTWWVFSEVCKDLNYSILYAEVDNIGYKRTKRGTREQPNELYRVDKDNKVIVDDGKLETVLDYMRKIEW